MATLTPQELGRGLFRVLETGDADLAATVVAPDMHNETAAISPAACKIPGPAGTLASGTWLRYAFTDLILPIEHIVAEGDQVWVKLSMRGRHDGAFIQFDDNTPIQALPPTHRDIDVPQLHLLTVRDGQVVRHAAVRDDLTMLAQLGAFPPSPELMETLTQWTASGRVEATAAEIVALCDKTASAYQPL
jgi:predicted ester cyclase